MLGARRCAAGVAFRNRGRSRARRWPRCCGDQPIAADRSYRVVTNASMLEGLHRYRIGEGRDPQVLDRSVTEVVEASMERPGTVRAPRTGNVTLIGSAAR